MNFFFLLLLVIIAFFNTLPNSALEEQLGLLNHILNALPLVHRELRGKLLGVFFGSVSQ